MMPKVMGGSLLFTPLLPTSDFAEFVPKLEVGDVHARFGRPIETEKLPQLLGSRAPGCRAIGAWKGRSLVGVVMLARLPGEQCEVALIVRSDMKRRRIGTALMRCAFTEAVELGARAVVAHVRPDNRAALGLVRSLGFTTVGGPGLELFYTARLSIPQAVTPEALPSLTYCRGSQT